MSVLSTVTSSLPNLLNLLQGRWGIQYKINKKQPPEEQSMMAWISNGIQSVKDFVSGTDPLNDEFEWKDIQFDSFLDMKEVQDTQISQSPVENGEFKSINKVRKPKMVRVTIAKAGIGYGIEDTLSEIKMLLPLARYTGQTLEPDGDDDSLLQSAKNLITDVSNLAAGRAVKDRNNTNKPNFPMEFRVITPFDVIDKLNLIKIDYTFKQDTGRNMLILYLTFQEILEKSSFISKATKTPSNKSNEDVGKMSLVKG